MGQIVLFPELEPPQPEPKVNPWPAIIVALVCFGLTLAIVPWSLDYEKRHAPKPTCKDWGQMDKKTGDYVCVKWSGGERVLK